MGVLDRIPELACPACKGDLADAGNRLRCHSCGRPYDVIDGIPRMLSEDMLVFAAEIAVQDRVAVEYEAKRYQDPEARKYHAWWTDQMLARVRTDGRILDNGCGIGLLHDRLPAEQVVGLDISSEMLGRAAEHSDRLILGNSQELPLKGASFDVAFCRSLLHHLPQPERAIAEMHRVLRPGGELVVVDTNSSILSALPRRIAYRGEHFSDEHKNLNRRVLERYLTPHFTVDDVMYFGYVAYPLLGFPDLVSVYKYVPLKSICSPMLMAVDHLLARIPLVRTQSWGILIKGTRRQSEP